VTKGFASGVVFAVIAWLFMWACWVSIAFQQASRHGIQPLTYTFIGLMTVLVVSPVYIPADVTTACQKLYSSLNELYASDDVEQVRKRRSSSFQFFSIPGHIHSPRQIPEPDRHKEN
jgi:hypothetical protein